MRSHAQGRRFQQRVEALEAALAVSHEEQRRMAARLEQMQASQGAMLEAIARKMNVGVADGPRRPHPPTASAPKATMRAPTFREAPRAPK